MSEKPWAVGVDVGGTKTQLLVARGDGLVDDVLVPTSSWWARGVALGSPENAAALVGLVPGPVPAGSVLVVGAHGVDSDDTRHSMRLALEATFPGRVHVQNDAALIGPAAGYLGAVISVIAGTGSIVHGRFADGHTVRLGGHGYLVDDEGSAPALVRSLARALARASDWGETDEIALTALAQAAGVGGVDDRLAAVLDVLQRTPDVARWGSLAPAIFEAADAGSPLGARVVREQARVLAALVDRAFALGVDPDAVVLAGGVMTAQRRLSTAVAEAIRNDHPGVPVEILRVPPVRGAGALARELLRHPYVEHSKSDSKTVKAPHPLSSPTQPALTFPEGAER